MMVTFCVCEWKMKFFLNGAELSLDSVNSEKMINH